MENFLSLFQQSLKTLGISKKDRLLLTVSGGLDSVVLAACCHLSDLDFGMAHANFQLRGAESERDEDFVRQLSARYDKPFFVKKFDTSAYAETQKCSIQVSARELRYEWFENFIGNGPDHFNFLLTAHHLDDNIETLLMHFFRGTGIAGLHGIPQKNKMIVRPLLSFSKESLRQFALSQNLDWVEDSSNASNDYTRNELRNQIIPSLARLFPEFRQNMENNILRFSEAEMLYQESINRYKKKLMQIHGSEIHVPILLLQKSSPQRSIIYEIIKDYQFSPAQIDDVLHLMESKNGKYISSPSHRIIRNRRWLIIAPLQNTDTAHIVIDQDEKIINYLDGHLQIKTLSKEKWDSFPKDLATGSLDAGKIHFPLLLRKWKAGDYFYPLGMKKKKKIARFLIDQKLSKTAKEKIWVVVMDSQIIWVVGHRIDNRFQVSESTSQVLEITNGPVKS
jgi:tRNA(Ile)-lysidine synthase